MTTSARRIAADMVYDRLTHVLPDNATREDAAWLLSKAKFRAGVSDEVRDEVLSRFEPEHVPVPGLDFLPVAEPVTGVCRCGFCHHLGGVR